MGENSKITWTHHTFNHVLGCSKVHAGCTNCYAETEQAIVMRKGGRIHWGEVWQGGERVVVADSTWKHPFTWARKAAAAGERHRVFCASLSDVLEIPAMPPSSVTAQRRRDAVRRVIDATRLLQRARERLWPIIEDTAWMCGGCGRPCAHSSDTPHRTARLSDLASVGAACAARNGRCTGTPMGGLDFLLLTKRPENATLVPAWVRALVWLGTSVSDQETADEWARRLLAAEGFRYWFLSVEPMVGPIDFGKTPCGDGYHNPLMGGVGAGSRRAVDWVIVGGESGPKARPCHVEWIRSIVRQCAEAGVPCHVKQLGTRPQIEDRHYKTEEWPTAATTRIDPDTYELTLSNAKGGSWDEWPEDLRVRQFPK